jgi:hypothetical protein
LSQEDNVDLQKHSARDLIDIHSIKDFSMFHTKVRLRDKGALCSLFLKSMLFPLHIRWWHGKISTVRLIIGTALYVTHLLLLGMYWTGLLPGCVVDISEKIQWDLYLPVLILVLYSVAHARSAASSIGSSASTNVNTNNNGNNVTSSSSRQLLHPASPTMSAVTSQETADYTTELAESDDSSDEEPASLEDIDADDDMFEQSISLMSVNVCIWSDRGVRHKVAMTLSELRRTLAAKADATPQQWFYRIIGTVAGVITALIPLLYIVYHDVSSLVTAYHAPPPSSSSCVMPGVPHMSVILRSHLYNGEFFTMCDLTCLLVATVSFLAQLCLTMPLFRMLSQAELTFTRRYMYARCFKSLTSAQRAARHGLPSFSLKNILNIKFWLILRAGRGWLSRQKHQREADAAAAIAFICSLLLAAMITYSVFVSTDVPFPSTLIHWEVLSWCVFISLFLLRFMVLGTRINAKYNDSTVLLTEQINLHLRILQLSSDSERGKEKRESLQVANNVLKLSTKLLKEFRSPNQISGLAMNRLLYNITRVVLLSAMSSALTGPLGFNVRLWKLAKIK